ncbi:HBL017Cp [Eremothecium sinecaudum]|uniref:HBL017Cp n=1 Tax=Eremothecium sinecaudum TaxID=45286 RepID=A0A120K110_9SACH|nr:HBL017Cp [Eremothecium sinecaudum]AMD18885.1 HBL017Cp [Eremothecium sinecaudum]
MKQYNVIVGEPEGPNETAPRRNAVSATAIIERPIGLKCNTAYEFLLECFERGGDRNAVAWRDTIEIYEDTKTIKKIVDGKEVESQKTWLYYELTPFKYKTYNELNQLMHDYGRGLVKIGLQPKENRIHIYAATSVKWLETYLASQTQALTVVTAYESLGEAGLTHSLVQAESRGIFVDNSLLPNLIGPIQKASNLKYIIHGEKIDPNDKRQNGKIYSKARDAVQKLQELRPDVEIYSMEEVIALGSENRGTIDVHPPTAEDINCIMYTSGSTGTPKGVVITHRNFVAGIGGVNVVFSRKLVTEKDRYLAILPLAHILELVVEMTAIYCGALVGYGTVKTVSDASVRNCKGDMKEFKPHVMVGTAAVWEGVRKGIQTQIDKLPKFKQKVFWFAYRCKLGMKKYHIPGGTLLGNLVFKKAREATGGNLRIIFNGGSLLSKDTQIFISNLLAPVLIGYGLTETVANGALVDPRHFEYDVTGELAGSITAKLVDVEELGYFAKNNQGEIWIKGASVFKQYFCNEEETAAAFEDGWLKTGDIGEWKSNGILKIIDRKKNLVKTRNGEYIALEKLESVYRSSKYVANICIYADQYQVKPIAIVVPREVAVVDAAKKLGLIDNDGNVDAVLNHEKLKSEVLKDMIATAKAAGLAGIELILGFVFAPEEWTPENGFLTPSQKLQRRKILDAVREEVDKLYASNS